MSGIEQLTDVEDQLRCDLKNVSAQIGSLVEKMERSEIVFGNEFTGEFVCDQKWVAEAKMELEKGLMSLDRAINKRGFFQ